MVAGESMEKLAELQAFLSERLLEREEVVEGALVALGCRQHVLLVGPPGTAKSQLVSTLARSIGLSYFEHLLTRFSTPEEVFGPISVQGLQQDQYRRITAGRLPEAELAFIDEVFKASPAILNSLLTLMNERVFHNNGQPAPCPLVSLFGASNELPEGRDESELAAFADRFLFRYQVGYLAEDGHFAAMLALPAEDGTAGPAVTAAELAAFQAAARSVKANGEVFEALVALRRSLANEEGIIVSDRRWRQALSALKAKAALVGATEVSLERDFDVLVHLLWHDPAHRKPVAKLVRRIADPLFERVTEIAEEAEEIYKAALNAAPDNASSAGLEANKKLKDLLAELRGILSKTSPGARPRVERVEAKLEAWNGEVLQYCLGISLTKSPA